MKIVGEEALNIIKMEFDLTDSEMKSLIEYAVKCMSIEKLNELKIEWAVNDILEKYIKKEDKDETHKI